MANYTFKKMFTSSIGKKLIMGLTGIFLISFLTVHCIINACIFAMDNGELFNKAAHFMGTNIFIRIMEVGLFAGIILHIVQGLVLTFENNKKTPVKYAVNNANQNSKWYSRSMGLLGTLLLIFLIMHIYHFWTMSRIPQVFGYLEEVDYDGKTYHNLFHQMVVVFENPIVVALYVLSMISLAYHLLHGFSSAFQSLGLNHKKYTPIIKTVGTVFSIVVPIIFALMPIAIFIGFIK